MTNSIHHHLKQAATRNLGRAFQELDKYLRPVHSHINNIYMLQARYSRLQEDKIQGTKTDAYLNTEENNILKALLELIDLFSESDLLAGADVLDKHYERILLVCSLERATHVKEKLFPNRYFPNAMVVVQTIEVSQEAVDIILYDKESFAPDFTLYEQYVKFGPAPVLWFGQGFAPPIEGEAKNSFYYANSDFSVYARLREMLDYLKYFDADK